MVEKPCEVRDSHRANDLSWEYLKVLLLEEYFPRGEIQKIEQEL